MPMNKGFFRNFDFTNNKTLFVKYNNLINRSILKKGVVVFIIYLFFINM